MQEIFFLILCIIMILIIVILLAENSKLKNRNKNNTSIISDSLQAMYKITLDDVTVQEKLKKLNEILMNSFLAKYSSIVLYDGKNYEIKASNVEESFGNAIANIAEDHVFKTNISNNTSKYIVAEQDKDLSYKTSIERKIKSAIFTPIYYNNIYLGFWIVEDVKEHAFDNITEKELGIFKDNVNIFIENIRAQNTIELAENTDKQTGFYNNMYLYSNARNILNDHQDSSISIICLKNIPEINEKYGRNVGNTLILRIANIIKEIVSQTSIIIRYTGIRILIITPGSNAQTTHEIMERILFKIKNEIEYIENDKVNVDAQILIRTLKTQSNIEKEVQSIMSYLDYMNVVNTIKII